MRSVIQFFLFGLLAFLPSTFAAFGVTTSGSNMVVDSGAGLVTTSKCINTANGDITSMLFNGKQLQDSSKFTQLSSGLGSATVTSNVANNIAVITIKTSTITHYYIVKSGVNTLYIGTFASAEPTVGELRFIARLSKSALPNGIMVNGESVSEVNGPTAIEGSDVFLLNGQTRSKFYSSVRFIQDQVHGVTGSGVGVFMIIPGVGYETSSGGPFFRDINNQGTAQQELYFYMNSGHEQTESFRTGFFGPYAMTVTTGAAPSASLDTSFMDNLGLQGYVPASGRGTVSGSYSGTLSGQPVTIGFKNSAAQYWIAGSGGSFSRNMIKPGTYTVTLFQGEIEAGSGSVTVNAGQTSTITLTSTVSKPSVIWSIGTVDGTPAGFLNADKIQIMHPSDTRMSSWGPVTFTIGSSSASSFPMAQFKEVNNPTTINGRHRPLKSPLPSLTPEGSYSTATLMPLLNYPLDSVTRGTWRGINQVCEWVTYFHAFHRSSLSTVEDDFAIPSGTLVAGSNTIAINVISGSSGDVFLSPNFVYDSIELF
ncbi:putative rhamnogalacturonate lyase A [Flammula alnicola]|nr:putative rhamnogalacturonate lyase A [Flammula alnicola]